MRACGNRVAMMLMAVCLMLANVQAQAQKAAELGKLKGEITL